MVKTFDPFLQILFDSPIAVAIREGVSAFPWIESVHVLTVTLVVGTILIVDLRLLGYRSHRAPAHKLIVEVLPYTWASFVIAVAAGSLMFISNALKYAHNPYFQGKMIVMLVAGINMAIFHLTVCRRIKEWDETLPTPRAAKIAGAMSLLLWTMVIFLGRWVGFTLF